jgi:hypothetical protein
MARTLEVKAALVAVACSVAVPTALHTAKSGKKALRRCRQAGRGVHPFFEGHHSIPLPYPQLRTRRAEGT